MVALKVLAFFALISLILALGCPGFANEPYQIVVRTGSPGERGHLVSMGFAIDNVDLKSGNCYIITDLDGVRLLQNQGFSVDISLPAYKSSKSMVGYHDQAETAQYIQDLLNDYPTLTHGFSIGTTLEEKEILCLKISDNPEQEEGEPGFLLAGRHHAREPLSTELALETATRLLEGYSTSEFIQYLVNEREIYIIPTVNPDGAVYDEEMGYDYWRKNRNPNTGLPGGCMGVDPNRNYSYEWGRDSGSSGYTCDNTYRGVSPFSELETAAIRDFIAARAAVTTFITIHTYGELILYPFGYDDVPVPDPVDRSIFEKSSSIMASYNSYTATPAYELYPLSGEACDWAYGEHGIFCYTFELSPANSDPGFYPPDSIFTQVFDDNWPAMTFMAAISKNPEMVLSCDLWKLEIEKGLLDVTITWAPIVETDGSGYDVLRWNDDLGQWDKITSQNIPVGFANYQFVDSPPLNKGQATFTYLVRYNSKVDLDQEFGPLSVTFDDDQDDDDDNDDDNNDDDNFNDDDGIDDDADDDQTSAKSDNGCCG